MNTEKLTWYVARSGGIVAWALLAVGILLGLLLSSRVLGRKASPAWILSIHRYLGGLAVIFTAVHVAAIMLDDFVDFGFVEVLVPWASAWRPGAVAWGIVAMYLLVAIELTSFAMRRMPKGVWRGVHWTSAPLFVMATLHGYQAGTDSGRTFIAVVVAVCVILSVMTTARVVMARRATSEQKIDPRALVDQAKALRQGAEVVVEVESAPASAPAPSVNHVKGGPDPNRPSVEGAPLLGLQSPSAPDPTATPLLEAANGPFDQDETLGQTPTPAWNLQPDQPMPAAAPRQIERPAASAPTPEWEFGAEPAPNPELDWVSDEPAGNPRIDRREGPVPGVWKRSQRDLESELTTTGD